MPRKKQQLPVLYNQPIRGLSVINKRVLVIGLSLSEQDKEIYFKDRINELETSIKKYKSAINNLSEKREYIKALEGFRNMLTNNDCFIDIGNRKTIFQCSHLIKIGKCKIYNECEFRNNLIRLLNI